MSRIISVANQKGGVGKTTTAVTLSHGLALRGQKVLLIDCDAQGHVGVHLGIESEKSLYDLLSDPKTNKTKPQECAVKARENLDLILSNSDLATMELSLTQVMGREKVLKNKMKPVDGLYDFIILDTAPSLSVINTNAIFYANELIIPISMEFLALHGVSTILDFLDDFKEFLDHEPKLSLVVPTFYDRRNKKSDEVLESLKNYFGDKLSEPIRFNTKISEAPAAQQSVFEYSNKSRGAEDYHKLCERVLAI